MVILAPKGQLFVSPGRSPGNPDANAIPALKGRDLFGPK